MEITPTAARSIDNSEQSVSVVLPVRFVHWDWLEASIRSVLEQDYPELELIVVNDDATEDIDQFVADLGVTKYLKNDRNLKLPASLNRGFSAAEGRFHTWTSADNYMLPGMISKLVDALRSDDSAQIVVGPYAVVNADDEFLDSPGNERAAELSGTSLGGPLVPRSFLYYSTLGACFMYRREVFERLNGYDEDLHGAEDYDFWIRASRYFDILRMPPETPPLYAYRVHADSISATMNYCYTGMRAGVLRRELSEYPGDHDLKMAYRYHQRLYMKARAVGSFPFRMVHRLIRGVKQALERATPNCVGQAH